MSELVVFALDTETGAQEMADTVKGLQKKHLITLEDAAVVVRRQDGKVKVKQANDLVGSGALGGGFLGHADRNALLDALAGHGNRRGVRGHWR